jgi:hypothetical protein
VGLEEIPKPLHRCFSDCPGLRGDDHPIRSTG